MKGILVCCDNQLINLKKIERECQVLFLGKDAGCRKIARNGKKRQLGWAYSVLWERRGYQGQPRKNADS
jgi:hypothetical protein